MGFSTFSGPLRSGTQRYGSTENTGVAVLAQTYTIPTASLTTAGTAITAFYLPAGSKILSIGVEVTVALATATNVGLTVGVLGGSATQYMTSVNTGATAAKTAQSGLDAALQVANTNNVGTTDVGVTLTPTAATGNASAGTIVVTLQYMQRAADGAEVPTTFNV